MPAASTSRRPPCCWMIAGDGSHLAGLMGCRLQFIWFLWAVASPRLDGMPAASTSRAPLPGRSPRRCL